jgi:hypothetical protein
MSQLEQLVAAALPSIIDLVKALFVTQNPSLPVPTSAEVLDAYMKAYTSSIAIDELLKKKYTV